MYCICNQELARHHDVQRGGRRRGENCRVVNRAGEAGGGDDGQRRRSRSRPTATRDGTTQVSSGRGRHGYVDRRAGAGAGPGSDAGRGGCGGTGRDHRPGRSRLVSSPGATAPARLAPLSRNCRRIGRWRVHAAAVVPGARHDTTRHVLLVLHFFLLERCRL